MTHDEAKVLQNVADELVLTFVEETGAQVNEVWQLIAQYANSKWEED